MTYFEYEERGMTAILKFDRPPVNAMNLDVLSELRSRLDALQRQSHIRVLIMTAAGTRFFAAGADIKGIQGSDRVEGRKINELFQGTFQKVSELPIPTLCAVNGLALGAGMELALACDIRIASETAEFGLPESALGLIPGGGGTQRLPRLISVGKAKDLMFTGRRIPAQEAYQCGLVEHICSAEQLLPFTLDLAEQIARKGPIAIRMIKRAVDHGIETTLARGLELELELSEHCFDSHDFKEGVKAFLEKRPAEFLNR